MSGDHLPVRNRVVGVKLTEDSLVPVVIVKAAGEHADELLREAQAKGDVPVIRSPALTSKLYRIPIDHAVTPDLFPMMAALLAHVIQVDKHRKNGEPIV